MERLALVEVLHDRLGQVRPHHPCESHFREGRELLGHSRVRILAFIYELQRRPDALDGDRGARPRRGGPGVSVKSRTLKRSCRTDVVCEATKQFRLSKPGGFLGRPLGGPFARSRRDPEAQRGCRGRRVRRRLRKLASTRENYRPRWTEQVSAKSYHRNGGGAGRVARRPSYKQRKENKLVARWTPRAPAAGCGSAARRPT